MVDKQGDGSFHPLRLQIHVWKRLLMLKWSKAWVGHSRRRFRCYRWLDANFILKIWSMEQKDIDRIIEMAWEDRTPFEAIQIQFGFSEADVIKLMRRTLRRSSFNLWRKRVNSGTSQKHAQKRNPEITRFKSSLQKTISLNKISKRWKIIMDNHDGRDECHTLWFQPIPDNDAEFRIPY